MPEGTLLTCDNSLDGPLSDLANVLELIPLVKLFTPSLGVSLNLRIALMKIVKKILPRLMEMEAISGCVYSWETTVTTPNTKNIDDILIVEDSLAEASSMKADAKAASCRLSSTVIATTIASSNVHMANGHMLIKVLFFVSMLSMTKIAKMIKKPSVMQMVVHDAFLSCI